MNTLRQAEAIASAQDYAQELDLQDIKPSTVAKYRQCISTYQNWLGDNSPSEQSARAFLAHLRHSGLKPSTVELYYHALKPYLLTLGIIFKAKFKKRRIPPDYHSVSEVSQMFAAIEKRSDPWRGLKERDWLILAMLAYTGMRRGEILSLRLGDINFATALIRVTGKGDHTRIIPISPVIYEQLKRYTHDLSREDKLFPMKPRRLWQIVVNYARRAGLNDIHPHSFRHFFATQLVEQGIPLHQVKELLGHADISTTAIYLDFRPSQLHQAILSLPNLTEVQDD